MIDKIEDYLFHPCSNRRKQLEEIKQWALAAELGMCTMVLACYLIIVFSGWALFSYLYRLVF